ncbi:tetratricopeptide repeat protein [[Limnothrix rosea] IAM M-220]|uniref:tetratricopeptide repeat protein n=1 Tax=[Limnothrix rosea] IAM M-220 TaxID=454133 RepID=UPI0009698E58|nr:tetratricopeptide repeat protein [[Limnothrix rosea] IAM M-220]OKH17361.1 hypothetical protein NIES208_09740 [[Limnothrix rosea] IAM M-220]
MPSSSKKSNAKGKGKFWQKVILFIGGGAFLGTAMLPIIGSLLGGNSTPSEDGTTSQTEIPAAELQALEENLLVVLEREPNNPNALQNLIRVRLELGDLQGVIDPLDKLITLFPEDQVLKDLKVQIEENIVRTNPTVVPVEEGDGLTTESEAMPETPETPDEAESEAEGMPETPETPADE